MSSAGIAATRVASLAVALLAGCGYDARPARMAATGPGVPPLAGAVAVGDVTGGRENWALYITEVADRAVLGAVDRSLAQRGMLAKRDPRFRLEVQLADWQQPTHGDAMTVGVTLRCRLAAPGVARAYWEARVPSRFTAPLEVAAAGGARLRLANEGAVRAGLRSCLDGLAAVALAEPGRFAPGASPPPEPEPAGSPAPAG